LKFQKKTGVIVIGAGLAGLSVADALLKLGADVILIDKEIPGAGASGTPAALLNPATGRRGKMAWNASETVPFTISLLEKVQQKSTQTFFEKTGVLRPATELKMAEKMKKTFDETSWPDDWVSWCNDHQIQSTIPGVHSVAGGLMVHIGATINTPLFLDQWLKQLINNGLKLFRNHAMHSINELESSDFVYDFAVWTTGSALTESPDWKHIPFHSVKGQTITLRFKSPLNLPCSVSNLGYFAFLMSLPGSLTIGSTYEHSFGYSDPDEKAAAKLMQKFNKTFPEIKEIPFETKMWAGIRVNVPDRKPVAGVHPVLKNHFVLGALASKGLLHAPWLGMKLAESIAGNDAIPLLVSADRFNVS
jgi:glycine/D-amino acid oxidase-like deaminating enzyme